jgi:hypothetical protein
MQDTALPPMLEEEEETDAPDQEMINQELYSEENDLCSQMETQMNMVLPSTQANLQEEEDIELVEI